MFSTSGNSVETKRRSHAIHPRHRRRRLWGCGVPYLVRLSALSFLAYLERGAPSGPCGYDHAHTLYAIPVQVLFCPFEIHCCFQHIPRKAVAARNPGQFGDGDPRLEASFTFLFCSGFANFGLMWLAGPLTTQPSAVLSMAFAFKLTEIVTGSAYILFCFSRAGATNDQRVSDGHE